MVYDDCEKIYQKKEKFSILFEDKTSNDRIEVFLLDDDGKQSFLLLVVYYLSTHIIEVIYFRRFICRFRHSNQIS